MYYLRSKSAVNAIKFTVDVNTLKKVKLEKESEEIKKRNEEPQVC